MPGDVLVLDDEESYARMLADFLRSEGYNATMSTSPLGVLDLLKTRAFDLVVADYKMPEMDGADFLLKARQIRPGLPVIMVSGMMNTPDLLRVANIGVPLVLEKPFDTEVFLEYVSRYASPATAAMPLERAIGTAPSLTAKRSKIYPADLKYLSDSSASSRTFLQNLWQQLGQGNLIYIAMPPGSEMELLLHEVSRWKQADRATARKIKVSDLGETETLELLRLFANDTKFAPVVGVHSGDASFTEQILRILRFIPAIENEEALKDLVFVFQLTGWKQPQDPPADKDLPDFFSGRLLWLPPLRERPMDICTYAKRQLHQLDPGGKAKLTPEAVRLLLAYPWPGNYQELVSVLWSAWQLRESNEIGHKPLAKAIYEKSVLKEDPYGEAGLEEILRVRQSEYLTRLYNLYGEEIPSELLGAIDFSAMEAFDLETGPLLFPDLLERS